MLLTFPIYYCHEKRNFTLNLYLFEQLKLRLFFPSSPLFVPLFVQQIYVHGSIPRDCACTVAFTDRKQSMEYLFRRNSASSKLFEVMFSPLRATVYKSPPTGRASSSSSSSSISSSKLPARANSAFSTGNSSFLLPQPIAVSTALIARLVKPQAIHGTRGTWAFTAKLTNQLTRPLMLLLPIHPPCYLTGGRNHPTTLTSPFLLPRCGLRFGDDSKSP